MISPEIATYIKTERKKGTADTVIRSSLLANGWNEGEVSEAMSASAPTLSQPELKKYRQKNLWLTFFSLAFIDFVLIIFLGGQGVFGLSAFALIARIVVIFFISYFSSRTARPGKTTLSMISISIAKVLGAIIVALIVIMGLFYLYCLFAVSSSGL